MATREFVTYPRESVGAGDYEVQETQMIEGPNRWAVMKFTGRGWYSQGTCKTRAEARREAIKQWNRVLREIKQRTQRGYW